LNHIQSVQLEHKNKTDVLIFKIEIIYSLIDKYY